MQAEIHLTPQAVAHLDNWRVHPVTQELLKHLKDHQLLVGALLASGRLLDNQIQSARWVGSANLAESLSHSIFFKPTPDAGESKNG